MLLRPVAALLLLSGAAPAIAAPAAQTCESRGCTPSDFRSGVAELHQLKSDLVAALREFVEAASGSYGDEGRLLAPRLDAAQRALDAWDRAIAIYEAAARAAPAAAADVHAALGSVYLDRLRVGDTLREFEIASTRDARRADIHDMAAMAYALAGDTRRSIQELERASAIAPDNLATLYRLAQALAESSSPRTLDVQRRLEAARPPSAPGQPDAPAIQFDRIGLVRQVSGVAPIFPPQRYVRGFRSINSGQYAEGLAGLRGAIAEDPLSTVGASAAVSAGTRLRQGQLQAALSALRTGLADAPSAEAERVAGVAYWADAQYDRSIERLRSAMRANPADERARIALADVLVAAGKASDAERLLAETLRLMPESGLAHYRLAQLYQSESRVPDAIAQFEQAAACSPLIGLDHLFETIGGLYLTQADFDHAVAAYRKRVDVNPNNADAHRKLGEIYALQGRDDGALVEFTVAQWLNPRNAEAFAAAGQSYLRMERFADAVRVSREALALDPAQQKARFTLGTALTRLGNLQEGERELDRFQRELDESAALRRHVAELNEMRRQAARFEAAGDYAQAVSALRNAAAAAPDEAQIELDLARLLVKTGQPQDALEHLAKAHPPDDNADVHRLAAEAYAALGRADARDREDTRYRQLVEQQKEERLRTRPLLR
jgi:tetratricopeptide (TPR) repeat protein